MIGVDGVSKIEMYQLYVCLFCCCGKQFAIVSSLYSQYKEQQALQSVENMSALVTTF